MAVGVSKRTLKPCWAESGRGFEISFTCRGTRLLIAASREAVTPRRIILGSYFVLLAGCLLAASAWFVDAHAEYRQLKVVEQDNEQKLADARRRLAEHQKVLERMKTDPLFVEKVIREKIKFVKPGEWVWRFED